MSCLDRRASRFRPDAIAPHSPPPAGTGWVRGANAQTPARCGWAPCSRTNESALTSAMATPVALCAMCKVQAAAAASGVADGWRARSEAARRTGSGPTSVRSALWRCCGHCPQQRHTTSRRCAAPSLLIHCEQREPAGSVPLPVGAVLRGHHSARNTFTPAPQLRLRALFARGRHGEIYPNHCTMPGSHEPRRGASS